MALCPEDVTLKMSERQRGSLLERGNLEELQGRLLLK
jgi:hypothetical protein